MILAFEIILTIFYW